jgi:hypothetical protein
MTEANARIEAIQAMLAAGHRSVHLERHSLLLLGGVGAFLSIATEWVITDARFPEVAQRGFALLAWLAIWLGGMSLLDHWLTRRARQARDETLPFAQAQITRAWWMLLSVGSLGSFAMFFYGGGAMVYALWIVLLGLGVYLFGLFSRPLIEWIGLAIILLGVTGLAAGLPYGSTRWLAASAFGIGLPLAGWLNTHAADTGLARRIAVLGLWLVAVALPPLLVTRYAGTETPSAPAVHLAALRADAGEQVVRLEAGTRVPLLVDLSSDLMRVSSDAELSLTLDKPIEVALRGGRPDGRYRFGDGPWHEIRDGILRLNIDHLRPRLEDGRPVVRATARFALHEKKGDQP